MSEACSPTRAPSLLSPWRRRCQWATTLLLLLTPWFHVAGNSLFRIDIPDLTIYLFGQTLRIEELYIVLLFSLCITLGFLLTTMLLGRVWCGWFCPQTTLTDLVEWFSARLGIQGQAQENRKHAGQHVALQLFCLLLAFLVSANLLWYFIEPKSFFSQLISGQLHYAAWIFLVLSCLTVYLDLVLVRRLMCSDFCPYGRFQTVLADQTTLILNLPEKELSRCIKCESCVRVCPMQIDIRQGYQVECINCGRCLDACRQVMAKRDQPGLIRYSFGTTDKGLKPLLNPRTMLLGLAFLALILIMVFAVSRRPQASLKIAVSHSAASRNLADGTRVIFFNAWLNNRSTSRGTYQILARRTDNGSALDLKGQTERIIMAAGENLRVDFALLIPEPEAQTEVEFMLVDQAHIELAVTKAKIIQ